MDLPIVVLWTIMAVSFGLPALAYIYRSEFPPSMVMFIIGAIWLIIFLTTENLVLEYLTGALDDVIVYDVESSTGQVLINSISSQARGERLTNTSSQLTGDTIDCITVYLGRSGSPPATTLITVGVMDTSTQFVKVFGTMNVTSLLSASNQPYDFCLPIGDTYTFTDTETVGIKWNSGDATNTLTSRIDGNNPFDGNNTEHVNSTTGLSWSANAGQDIMMQMMLRGGDVTPVNYEIKDELTLEPTTVGLFFIILSLLFILVGVLVELPAIKGRFS